jgi:hypothetical protein
MLCALHNSTINPPSLPNVLRLTRSYFAVVFVDTHTCDMYPTQCGTNGRDVHHARLRRPSDTVFSSFSLMLNGLKKRFGSKIGELNSGNRSDWRNRNHLRRITTAARTEITKVQAMPKKVVDLHPLDRRLNLPVISTLNPKWVSKQNNYIQLHPQKQTTKNPGY